MIIKTGELKGAALDWAVCMAAHGKDIREVCARSSDDPRNPYPGKGGYRPSTDWSHGGPLIEKYGMKFLGHKGGYIAVCDAGESAYWSESHMVAAMRTIVGSEMGDEVDVPDVLVQQGESK